MTTKILTVSIAAYNVSKYLDEALLPFIQSKYRNEVEVLIIDDGSKDDTAKIASKYQEQYPNTFKLISKENGGWGSTLNTAIKIGTGKYFKQLDGDDYFSLENLDNFIDFIKTTDADLIHSPFMTFSDINGAILRIYSSGWDLPWRKTLKISEIPFFFPAMHTVTVKLTILQENSIFITEKCFYTDVEFVLKIINHCLTFSYYELPVYYYRLGRTGQSVSIEGLRKNWKDHLKMLYTILEYQKNNILTEQVNHLITERIRNVCEWQYLSFLYLENPNDQIKKELISFDEKLKKQYPQYYKNITNNRIKLLRKTNFMGLTICGKIQTYQDKIKKRNAFEGT